VLGARRWIPFHLSEVAAIAALADVILTFHIGGAGGFAHTGLACASAAMATFAADGRHVGAVAAYRFAAFPSRHARFIGCEFVSGPFCVSCPATLARNLTLLRRIHRCKTALARIRHESLLEFFEVGTAKCCVRRA